jgi:hypothetical protein
MSGSATDPTAGTDSGGGMDCPEVDEILLPQVPTVQLVVDQSGSMSEDFGGATRWDAMYNTLVGPANGVVTRLQSDVRFGLTLYTGEGPTCPVTSGLSPQLDAVDEITAALDATGPSSDTPTGESLVIATQTLVDDTWEGDKVLLLVTDGEPDTCAVPNPTTDMERDAARAVAIDAVVAAHDMGIRTFVVSVGTEVAQAHLQDIANAGVGNGPNDPDAPFYVANNQGELVDAVDEIIAGVRQCSIDLPQPLTEPLAPSCTVTINDQPIDYNTANGWALDGEMAIVLQGTSCLEIQTGAVAIQMTCTCEVPS